VHLLGESPRRLAVATAADGWIELGDRQSIDHRLTGQLESSAIRRFGDWAGRITAGDDEGDAWVFDGDGWRPIQAPPPIALPVTTKQKASQQAAFRPRADGKLFAVFRDEGSGWRSEPPLRAQLVTALCEGQRCQVLGQEKNTLSPHSVFVTPDDALWALDDHGLWAFQSGRWTQSTFSRGSASARTPRADRGIHLVAAPRFARLLEGTDAALMWPGAPGAPPRLVPVGGWQLVGPLRDDIDVVACGGRVFAAGSAGVGELNLDTRSWSRFAADGASAVRRLGCDREGGLWLAGYGLWKLRSGRAIPATDLDGLIGGREIRAVGNDTGAGLPIAIENRGVAVLLSSTATAAPTRALDEGDAARASPGRQAVFVSIDIKDERALMKELQDALWNAKAGAFAGWYRAGFDDPIYWLFYGPDAGRMVDVIRAVLERSGRPARLLRRDGPRGAPEQRIEISKPARPVH
jgi:hypothetical protein